jgi:hypothetical protein
MYRVVFPFELKLPNTTDDAAGRDALYSLFAVVVHVGSGPHHGELPGTAATLPAYGHICRLCNNHYNSKHTIILAPWVLAL